MSAQRYRKKPVVISAVRWDGEPNDEVELWLGESFESWLPSRRQLEIRTLEGPIFASAGDWIIRGVQGEFYPCKPDIFDATYESAANPPVAFSEDADGQVTVEWPNPRPDWVPVTPAVLESMVAEINELRRIKAAT